MITQPLSIDTTIRKQNNLSLPSPLFPSTAPYESTNQSFFPDSISLFDSALPTLCSSFNPNFTSSSYTLPSPNHTPSQCNDDIFASFVSDYPPNVFQSPMNPQPLFTPLKSDTNSVCSPHFWDLHVTPPSKLFVNTSPFQKVFILFYFFFFFLEQFWVQWVGSSFTILRILRKFKLFYTPASESCPPAAIVGGKCETKFKNTRGFQTILYIQERKQRSNIARKSSTKKKTARTDKRDWSKSKYIKILKCFFLFNFVVEIISGISQESLSNEIYRREINPPNEIPKL
jgi:hypothetical protein